MKKKKRFSKSSDGVSQNSSLKALLQEELPPESTTDVELFEEVWGKKLAQAVGEISVIEVRISKNGQQFCAKHTKDETHVLLNVRWPGKVLRRILWVAIGGVLGFVAKEGREPLARLLGW